MTTTHQKPARSDAIESAIQLYENANEICHQMGLNVVVAMYNLPRAAFDRAFDDRDDSDDGVLVATDARSPMWMKRCGPSVTVYTSESPRLE